MKSSPIGVLVGVVVSTTTAWAQPPPESRPTAFVTRGQVVDALGQPVPGAAITIEGSDTAARTDRDGWFRIAAPLGASLVVTSAAHGVGLATVDGAQQEIVLAAQLGETVMVESAAPAAAPGAARLDRAELQRIPGTGGDLVRA